jgi:hypothetical protein
MDECSRFGEPVGHEWSMEILVIDALLLAFFCVLWALGLRPLG